MGAPTTIDFQVKKTAVALYASGKTCAEAAAMLGVSTPSVWQWVNAMAPSSMRPSGSRQGAKPGCEVARYKARQWQPPVTGSGFIRPLPVGRLMAGR